MADRLNYFFRQRVQESELDLAFELLEKADRNLAADTGVYGIISGAEPTPHAPVPDLTIDLTAPGRAYDNLGQRIFFGTGQTVDCAVDFAGLPTGVPTIGQERWLGIFLRFDRLLSDPRTDGNSQRVFFRQDESFKVVVRQAPPKPAGSADKVALQPDEILICDVRRAHGQTQILAPDIDTSRRQVFIASAAEAVEVTSDRWTTLQPVANTVQAALDKADAELTGHFTGTARRHDASAIDIPARGFVAATNVEGAIHELVDDLSSAASGTPGAQKVGADAVPGTPHALPAGHVDGQLSQILAWLNAHVGAAAGSHNASAIAAAVHSYIGGTSVQAQLQEIVTKLAAQADGTAGASLVGADAVSGVPNALTAGTVDAQIAALLKAINDYALAFTEGHVFSGLNNGYHDTIWQPNLGIGDTKALLWDALGMGSEPGHLRVYADNDSIWFTLNAYWDGHWVRDSTIHASGALRLSPSEIQFLHKISSAPKTFTSWTSVWTLPMGSTVNSGFEVSGTVREVGRAALQFTNAGATRRQVSGAGAVTLRSRFPTTPSSITFATLQSSASFSGAPSAFLPDRDGFGYYSYQTVDSGTTAWWYGTYTAIA